MQLAIIALSRFVFLESTGELYSSKYGKVVLFPFWRSFVVDSGESVSHFSKIFDPTHLEINEHCGSDSLPPPPFLGHKEKHNPQHTSILTSPP